MFLAALRWRATEMPVCFDMTQRSIELSAYKSSHHKLQLRWIFPSGGLNVLLKNNDQRGGRERILWQKHRDVKMIPDLECNIIVDDENKLLGFLNDVHLKKRKKSFLHDHFCSSVLS